MAKLGRNRVAGMHNSHRVIPGREAKRSEPGIHTPMVVMDSGPAPRDASRNDDGEQEA